MSTQKFSSAIISVLMLASAVAPAQKTATHNDTWKKIVAREVNISEKPDEKQHHFHSPGTDTGITELIYDAVRSGKVIAYNAFDTRLVEKLTTKEIENPFSIPPDTQVIVDPITGIGKITITHADIDYDRFYKYRILEEWTFDRAAGNIGINIIAVAPMMDVYGASGDSRVQRWFSG